jgi:hypothetical protein
MFEGGFGSPCGAEGVAVPYGVAGGTPTGVTVAQPAEKKPDKTDQNRATRVPVMGSLG